MEPFGTNTAIIKAAPEMINLKSIELLVKDVLSELTTNGRLEDAFNEKLDDICASIACHGSIRAGQKLQNEEISALLKQLGEIDLGAHCPHGRPVVRSIPFSDMKKWFDRT